MTYLYVTFSYNIFIYALNAAQIFLRHPDLRHWYTVSLGKFAHDQSSSWRGTLCYSIILLCNKKRLDIFLILVVYILQNKNSITVYVPRGLWYDFYTRKSFFSIGKHFTFPVQLTEIPLLIRGGSILPTQIPGATTTESRKNIFSLLVALNDAGYAKGELYWDDGDSIGM